MTHPVDHFIVVGAGASMGARPDLLPRERPPLGKELAQYLLCWHGANEPKRSEMAKCATPSNFEFPSANLWGSPHEFDSRFRRFLVGAKKDFEQAMGDFVTTPSGHCTNDLRVVNRIIAQSMLLGRACRFSEKPDLYDVAIKHWLGIERNQRLAIVSINYDILIEEAVARVLEVRDPLEAIVYPGIRGFEVSQSPGRRIPVYKPHGSINWIAGNSPARGAVRQRLERHIEGLPKSKPVFESRLLIGIDSGFEHVPAGGRPGYITELKKSPQDVRPILALYKKGKDIPSNEGACKNAASACLSAVRENPSAAVTVCGLRPPSCHSNAHDEPFLFPLFQELRQIMGMRVKYVSPCDDDCNLASYWGFSPVRKTLEDYLSELAGT